jgi:probable rRNA maturation factor
MIDLMISGTLPKGLTAADLEQAIRLTFKRTRHGEQGSVSVAFISARRMQELNRRWRKKNRSTDVLSFAPAEVPHGPVRQWGDILIDPVYVRAEAKRRAIPYSEEILRVAVHGMLHLFGFDHATEKDELRMFTVQEHIVADVVEKV